MNQENILEHISQFLHTHNQMVIATQGEHPWIATVYYAIDDHLHFYFISNPKTLHSTHISSNPHIALSVSDAPQLPSSKKKGVQIFGTAKLLEDEHEITSGLELWRKALNITSDAYTYEGMKKNTIQGRLYTVIPKKIKYFNEELWEEGDEKMLIL